MENGFHVPYKAAQALQDNISGQLNTTFAIGGLAMPSIRAGKLKPLAVVRNRRYKVLPGVPAAAVLPDFTYAKRRHET